jgi:hypothetical protein
VASPLLHNLITKPMLKDTKGDAKEPTWFVSLSGKIYHLSSSLKVNQMHAS